MICELSVQLEVSIHSKNVPCKQMLVYSPWRRYDRFSTVKVKMHVFCLSYRNGAVITKMRVHFYFVA